MAWPWDPARSVAEREVFGPRPELVSWYTVARDRPAASKGHAGCLAKGLKRCATAPPQASSLSLSPLAARHLTLEATLRGHRGCVNRLAWNEAGTLLASGSDDRRVLLWRYPDHAQRPPLRIETQHTGNIFGTRILPHSGDRLVVTGAMDYEVQLHRLEAGATPAAASPRSAAASSPGGGAAAAAATIEVPVQTTEYKCHRGRVKVHGVGVYFQLKSVLLLGRHQEHRDNQPTHQVPT